MRRLRIVISLLLVLILAVSGMLIAKADTYVKVDGYTYSLNSRGLGVLMGWDNSSDVLYVPYMVGNVYIAEIGDSAFMNDDYIKTLDLSDARRMYHIGEFAFCNSVLEGQLVIPSRVTYIGTSAFEGCNSLTEVQYSSDGGSVSPQCFMNCQNLSSVTLTSYITTIERYAFKGCTSLNSIIIPMSVTNIHSTAFYGCDNLVISCYYGSYAMQYAIDNGIDYNILDPENIPIEPPTEAPTEAPTTQPTEPVTEEPTQPTSATEAPTEEPTLAPGSYILGDADGSGYVDIVDATFIQRIATNIDVPISREILMHADVDGDDDLTAIDATLIMRHLIRITTPYPIGEQVTT